MSGTTLWLTMLGMGAITYGIRLSFILLWGKITMPPTLQRSLRFVPPAVLSAIIFPEILRQNGAWNVSPLNPRLLAGIIVALVAWRTRNTMLTILVGMVGAVDRAGGDGADETDVVAGSTDTTLDQN